MSEDQEKLKIPDRRLMGEAWMWCSECGARLHSFDGYEDDAMSCPFPSECEARNILMKERR